MNRTVVRDVEAVVSDPVIASSAGALAGQTVLLAGAGGLIARYTAFALAELSAAADLGIEVVCLVRDLAKAEHSYAAHPRRGDLALLQQDLGEPLHYLGRADVILHAGGASSPKAYAADPYGVAAANVKAVFDLVGLARHGGSRRIAYFSSREVYGTAAAPLTEDVPGVFDHLSPRNSYPEAKRMTESVLAAASAQFGIGFQSYRLASVYGPGMRLAGDGRAMADLVGARLAGSDLVLASDGSAVRGYCYVTDAVRGILTALLAGADDTVYNIANETEPVSIRALADLLATLPVAGQTRVPEVVLGPAATPSGYSTFGYVPVSTARLEALGWLPRVSLREGLVRTLESFGDDR